MNKKVFLFSFLLFVFSFCFIGNVKAYYTQNGITFNEEKIKEIYDELLPGNNIDYANSHIICGTKYLNSAWRFACRVYSGTISLTKGSYNQYGYYYTYTVSTGSFGPYFEYNTSTKKIVSSGSGSGSNGQQFLASSLYYSKDTYIDGVLKEKNLNFSSDYTINFHLNGGSATDYTGSSLVLHDNDFSLNVLPDNFNSYISNINAYKQYNSFDGWYYDSNFTQPYSVNDTISSDIDLYAKWRSKIYGTSNIDYIEFKFDNIPNMETNISFDYTFRSVNSDGSDNTIDFAQPFGREYYIGCDTDNQICSSDLRYKDSLFYDLGFIGYYYTHSAEIMLNSDIEHTTSSYSVIVPLENSFGNYVYLDFNSDDDYQIIVHYKNDVNSNSSFIQTVDITGKYGAVFLPLFDNSPYVADDSYYLTNFRVVGNVDIQMTDSRDLYDYNISQIYSMNYCNTQYLNHSDSSSSYYPISDLPGNIDSMNSYSSITSIPYSCNNSTGVFTFKIDNLTYNQTLRFVNHSYSELSDSRTIIEFDSRFFNYGILDTPYSTVEIIDPTTNVNESVGLSEFYNYFDEENISGSKLSFRSAFNRFLGPIQFIFKTITSLYNNYLNSSMQHYFFLVFCLTIIILLVRVIF